MTIQLTLDRLKGLLGVSLHAPTGLWRSRICVGGKHKVRYFKTAEEARAAYLQDKASLHPFSRASA
jgi:hypothetical protein